MAELIYLYSSELKLPVETLMLQFKETLFFFFIVWTQGWRTTYGNSLGNHWIPRCWDGLCPLGSSSEGAVLRTQNAGPNLAVWKIQGTSSVWLLKIQNTMYVMCLAAENTKYKVCHKAIFVKYKIKVRILTLKLKNIHKCLSLPI